MPDGIKYIEDWNNGLLVSHAKVEDSTFTSTQ